MINFFNNGYCSPKVIKAIALDTNSFLQLSLFVFFHLGQQSSLVYHGNKIPKVNIFKLSKNKAMRIRVSVSQELSQHESSRTLN